ncbi:MAG: hypothetical protein KF835_05830 [Xanthobacteraceae bacterium]|nr:hypothetical protein [Xanthobacteraceae bacterium]
MALRTGAAATTSLLASLEFSKAIPEPDFLFLFTHSLSSITNPGLLPTLYFVLFATVSDVAMQ